MKKYWLGLFFLLLLCGRRAGFAQVTDKSFRVPGENPIIRDVFTADPAVLVYQDTVFLYVGHDVATGEEMFNIPEWLAYSSSDMKNWSYRGVAMKGSDFEWGGGNSWASQVIEKDGKFWFYTTTNHAESGKDAIGVAVSDSPTGPFVDAIGQALVVDSMTPTSRDPYDWDDIDPTAFTDKDGTTWMAWGNLNLYLAKLTPDMTSIDGEIQEIYLPNYTEGPWLHEREGTYYLSYACFAHQAMWEKLCYATAPEITGPWEYQGIIMDRNERSYTIHPAITTFKGRDYLFYHTGKLTIGEESGAIGRRAVSIEYLFYNEDGTIQPVEKSMNGLSVPPKKNTGYVAPVLNPHGPLSTVISSLDTESGHLIAARSWEGYPKLVSTDFPYWNAIHSESFNGQESGRENAGSIGQSFSVSEDFTLKKIALYVGDGFGISEKNSVSLAVYDLGSNAQDSSYHAGENLLGDSRNLLLNYDPQAMGIMEIELTGDQQIQLQRGHKYIIELRGVRGTAPLFWYRTRGDMYPNGAAYKDRTIILDADQSSDFIFAIYE